MKTRGGRWRLLSDVRPALLLVVVAACCGCADSKASGQEPPSAGGAPAVDSPGARPPAQAGAPEDMAPDSTCTPQAIPESAEPALFEQLSAQLVTAEGAPALVESVQLCGFDLCLRGAVSEDGEVELTGPATLRGAAFKYGAGLSFAELVFRLEQPRTELGQVEALALPAVGSGSPLLPGSRPRSGAVELAVPPNAVIDIDTLAFSSPEQQLFRAATTRSLRTPAIPPALGIELIVAASPVGTTFCPNASLVVDNELGWPVDTEVELLLHGVSIEQEFAAYGAWTPQGTGRVSEDGARIEFRDKLPVLSTLGLRRVK